jgi:alkaline phosphatase D
MNRVQAFILALLLAASSADAADLMLGQGQMAGRVTGNSAILQSRLTAGSELIDGDLPGLPGVARFELSTNEDFSSAQVTPWLEALPENDYIVKTAVTGLKPATRYYYRLVYGPKMGDTSPGATCAFRTLGGKQEVRRASFAVVTGMNYFFFHEGAYKPETAYRGPDKHLGYPALASILKRTPDFFVGTGDTVYFDHPAKGGNRWTGVAWSDRAKTETEMRRKYHEQFRQPRFLDLFAQTPTYWEVDDHEYRYNDCDNTGDKFPSAALGAKNYREQLPVTDPDDPFGGPFGADSKSSR